MRRAADARRLARLRADDRGFVVVYGAILMGALFGLGGLVIDLGRLYNTNTELQSYADATALAAAAELDGGPNARARAQTAALNLIADTQTFGIGGANLTIAGFRFFQTLPPDTDAPTPTRGPVAAGHPEATSDGAAAFVEVTVRQETINLFFMPVLNVFGAGAPTQATTQAWATAGFTRFVCDITPLMICNPAEDPGGGGGFDADAWVGRQIRLKMQAQGSQWAPGDFGWLDASIDPDGPCPTNEGAVSIRCAMAALESITQCFDQRGVDVRPGQLGASGESGVNVRFDMFEGSFNGKKNDPNFTAAPNVTKGMLPNGSGSCPAFNNPDPSPDTVALPRDPCFGTGTCAGGGRFGDGNPDLGAYWLTNHGVGLPGIPDADGHAAVTTRYDVYAHEIATDTMVTNPPKAEEGHPQCNPPASGSAGDKPERRVVLAAVLNCIEHGVQGNASGVPVIELLKLFLTEPAGQPDTNDLWVEVLGGVQANAEDGVLHEFPVLYR